MAQAALGYDELPSTTSATSLTAATMPGIAPSAVELETNRQPWQTHHDRGWIQWHTSQQNVQALGLGSTGKGILIGMLSAFGSAALVGLIIAIVYFFRYTNQGRILLDRISRPGEFDDEQTFLREEEDALAEMDDLQRAEYFRAKGKLDDICSSGFGSTDHGRVQHLYSIIRPSPYRPTSRCRNSWRYKKRASRHGSSSRSWRLQIAS